LFDSTPGIDNGQGVSCNEGKTRQSNLGLQRISGQWRAGSTGRDLDVYDPFNGDWAMDEFTTSQRVRVQHRPRT